MIVRLERADDRDASLAVERAAFEGALEPQIVEAVRDEPGSFALVAVDDDLVGHVQLSRAWVGDVSVLALGPIGVLPARQGDGIGPALVAAALDEARRRGEAVVMLLGAPSYYGARGFEPASRFGLRNPFAGPAGDGFVIEEGDFQIAVLDPVRVEGLEGDVRWHPAFS